MTLDTYDYLMTEKPLCLLELTQNIMTSSPSSSRSRPLQADPQPENKSTKNSVENVNVICPVFAWAVKERLCGSAQIHRGHRKRPGHQRRLESSSLLETLRPANRELQRQGSALLPLSCVRKWMMGVSVFAFNDQSTGWSLTRLTSDLASCRVFSR